MPSPSPQPAITGVAAASPAAPETTFAQRATKDLLAGLTVSFVAISLGAAFGAFAGRGAMAGILSAGVIGFVCALFGGTRIQCSGPTAPMSAVMLGAVVFATQGGLAKALPGADPNQFLNITLVLTGATILLMGVLRLGRFISLVPKVVISGFMNGIAVLIWVGETKTLFGIGKDPIPGELSLNLAVALASLACCFLAPPLLRRIPKVGHYVPGALAAIVLMTCGVHALGLEIGLVQMGSGGGSVIDLVREQFPRDWSWPLVSAALPFVGSLALLAYLDTLLTALVVDKKVKEDLGLDDPTHQNKELAAQGLANAAVGLFGGIPGAQATIRSVLILKEGATMRLAGVAAGLFVLVEMIALQDMIALIPKAVFTGVLLKVGYDVMDWPPLKAAARQLNRRPPDPDAVIKHVAGVDLFFILGTTAVTILVNLNVAVISFVVLFYVLKRASVRVPDLEELADPGEEWISDHEEGLHDADLDHGVTDVHHRDLPAPEPVSLEADAEEARPQRPGSVNAGS